MPTRAEQRRLVWSGKQRKTTGGLTRDDLTTNRHGRIVSKRKSMAASKVNNLGTWLRGKDQKFSDVPAGAKKGSNGKPKKAAAKPAAKPKPSGSGTSGPSRKRQQPKPKVVHAPKKIKQVVKPKPKPKRKLGSKDTAVVLKKKAVKLAAKNTKAGPPISSIPKALKPAKSDAWADYKKAKKEMVVEKKWMGMFD